VPCADKEGERSAGALRFVHFASGNSKTRSLVSNPVWYRNQRLFSARKQAKPKQQRGEFEK